MCAIRRLLGFCFVIAVVVPVSGATTWKRVATISGHECSGRTFILEIPADWHAAGEFSRLRIQSSGLPEFVLTSDSGWTKYRDFIPLTLRSRLRNLVNSQYLYCTSVPFGKTDRTLLFVIGWPYASSPGSVHVIQLEGNRAPVVVFRKDEFEVSDLIDLDGDGKPEIVGRPCLSQEWGDHLLTYAPSHVYILQSGVPEVFSEALSRRYNSEHSYGWAGKDCSDKLAVVLHPPGGGKPRIMEARDAEKLSSTKTPAKK